MDDALRKVEGIKKKDNPAKLRKVEICELCDFRL